MIGARLILRHNGTRRGDTSACRNEWVVATLPVATEVVARIVSGAVCPACGGFDEIVLDVGEPLGIGASPQLGPP